MFCICESMAFLDLVMRQPTTRPGGSSKDGFHERQVHSPKSLTTVMILSLWLVNIVGSYHV